jgi:hypothetical protein
METLNSEKPIDMARSFVRCSKASTILSIQYVWSSPTGTCAARMDVNDNDKNVPELLQTQILRWWDGNLSAIWHGSHPSASQARQECPAEKSFTTKCDLHIERWPILQKAGIIHSVQVFKWSEVIPFSRGIDPTLCAARLQFIVV